MKPYLHVKENELDTMEHKHRENLDDQGYSCSEEKPLAATAKQRNQ